MERLLFLLVTGTVGTKPCWRHFKNPSQESSVGCTDLISENQNRGNGLLDAHCSLISNNLSREWFGSKRSLKSQKYERTGLDLRVVCSGICCAPTNAFCDQHFELEAVFYIIRSTFSVAFQQYIPQNIWIRWRIDYEIWIWNFEFDHWLHPLCLERPLVPTVPV